MDKFKDFWNNKTTEDKRKIIVYTITALVSILLLTVVYLVNNPDKNEIITEMENPDAKQAEKYNSRAEANQMGKIDSVNTTMDDLFGNTTESSIEIPINSEPGYVEPVYTQPNYNNNSPSQNNTNNNSNHNQHSTYGDYSMWQAEEPKNNSVGYTNAKGAPTVSKKRNTDPAYTEIPTSTYQEPTYQNQAKDFSQGKQIRAKLISQGYATPGRSLSFVLLETTKIGNENIAKGQVITGVSSEENNRLMVNFSSIKVKNKIVPVQMQLFGSDGMAGLPVSGSNSNNMGNEAGNRGRDIARDQVNRIPVIGGIISGVVGAGSRTSDNKIKLSNNIECIIVNYN